MVRKKRTTKKELMGKRFVGETKMIKKLEEVRRLKANGRFEMICPICKKCFGKGDTISKGEAKGKTIEGCNVCSYARSNESCFTPLWTIEEYVKEKEE